MAWNSTDLILRRFAQQSLEEPAPGSIGGRNKLCMSRFVSCLDSSDPSPRKVPGQDAIDFDFDRADQLRDIVGPPVSRRTLKLLQSITQVRSRDGSRCTGGLVGRIRKLGQAVAVAKLSERVDRLAKTGLQGPDDGAQKIEIGIARDPRPGLQIERGIVSVADRVGTGRAVDTPSLRFVGSTAPYMHDGRFETLRELLAATDGTMGATAHLDEAELADLIAYLRRL
ncbi:MAG: hypothetical protein AAF721_23990 [Myxococcota bacterium]